MNNVVGSIILLGSILLFGTAGYMVIEGSSFMDAFYMTFISITTVGFGEIIPLISVGRGFTMFLILVGMGFVLYLFSKITETVVEGGLSATLGRMKMKKKVARLNNHYIICGFGRIGKDICKILAENGRSFVVIESDPGKIESIIERGYLVLEGEATDDEILLGAGIKDAKGLIAVVSSDASNVYIALSARGLKSDLFIMARSSGDEGAETKLLRAGADKVISPYFIGATRMAQQIVRPTVIDFIDLTVHAGELGLRLEEMYVSQKASFLEKSLFDSGIRRDFDLIVVAIKPEHGAMMFNPNHQTVMHGGDTLVVLGDHINIKRLEKEL
ncbi:MAG: NAD-binding protein [Proteobacteria bacterium]|nr:NAD-binding protein [Pseudomonadota bacterium]MBU1715231.1 NAD-binding protein [Pseudomonadota bacterium]